MANKTILMSRIRQIFRLHAQGRSKKQISALTGCSRNTVKKYLYKFIEQRLTYTEIDQMSDHDLEQLFCPSEPVPKEERFEQLQKLLSLDFLLENHTRNRLHPLLAPFYF